MSNNSNKNKNETPLKYLAWFGGFLLAAANIYTQYHQNIANTKLKTSISEWSTLTSNFKTAVRDIELLKLDVKESNKAHGQLKVELRDYVDLKTQDRITLTKHDYDINKVQTNIKDISRKVNKVREDTNYIQGFLRTQVKSFRRHN